MKKWFISMGMGCLLALAAACSSVQQSADYRVVPLPNEITPMEGKAFTLDNRVKILYPEGDADMQRNAGFLAGYVLESTGKTLAVEAGATGSHAIVLRLGLQTENPEAYLLEVNEDQVTITGSSAAGVFYGIQTLRKSLPVAKDAQVVLPPVRVNDAPRFAYRGMMLDVCRHFFSLDSVKRYIDMLALHNINRFHWHLTDDQGWRIEIKKYPQLTQIGSQRKETVIGRNSGKYDGIPYGGYYTQEEAREIVAYAKDRYITVIPEFEMPGHMQGVLAAFPELGCTGGPYDVWTQWGVSEDVICAGNDKSLELIKDVLAELIEIFPSEYIHVGGDECPKTRWEKCPKCQAKIRQLGLKDDKEHTAEQRLQSYIITEAEKFLNAHGRKIIGWDEILEGGVAPNATVMAWRGAGEGVKAAKMRHDVIMVPTTYFYFDYYQTNILDEEPLAIGGYVPIEKVYSFEPYQKELTAEENKHIIGLQANLWTEYITSFRHVEYMVLPRMAALSEIQWTQPQFKDYGDFLERMPKMFDIYDIYGYNYARHLFDVKANFLPDTVAGTLTVTLSTLDGANIHYTLDGTKPSANSPKYTGPLTLKENCTFKAAAIRPAGSSRVYTAEINLNKASLKPIALLQPLKAPYIFNGALNLVDGLTGDANYKTGRWIAFYGNDMEAVIDFKQPTEISSVEIHTCVEKGDWVFDARGFSVAVSDDGKNFTAVASEDYPVATPDSPNGVLAHKLTFEPRNARYLKVVALSERRIPDWHTGKGYTGFLFVDEIVVE
ncbi:MAG TPA: family 20 glycosylhydrolase [Candidatus Odoribacter faecigallinarum]|uniref:beta-N-acetylhexosaminidase n=1 Tax=Candidatus Odoribacter faecigallinarum TaxID=2838706 RepID=A0A9D1V096_9BACT|nr:family 20 glycosylhydrolase [Candidatus Odoribacter faecigallinarum]